MNGWVKVLSTVFLVAVLVSLGWPAVAAPDVSETKRLSGEMVKSAQAMVEHGNAAHPDIMTKHAKAMIANAQKVLDSIPPGNKHGETAAEHIKTAIEQAKITITDQGMDTAEQAFNHATEADSHIQQMQ